MSIPRRTFVIAMLGSVAALTGCGGGNDTLVVTSRLQGTFTLNGKHGVHVGTVDAYSDGEKVASTAITPDGAFDFVNLPTGDYQLAVTGTEIKTPYGKPAKIRAQYADPKTSGLSVSVTDGENKRDFDLESN